MIGDYSLDELTKYKGKLYVIVKVFMMDWFRPHDSICYGLVELTNLDAQWPYILISGSELEKPSDAELETWRILHGENRTRNKLNRAKSIS